MRDSFENSNESLIKNQGENQPALNETVSIPEAETRVVTEPNPEEKPAVDQGDKKYPAPALTEKETKSSEEDAKNPSTETSSSDKDSKAETTLNKDSEAEASLSKDSKTDPTLNSVERRKIQLLLQVHFPMQVQTKLKRLQLQLLRFVVKELQLAIQKYTKMRITVNM